MAKNNKTRFSYVLYSDKTRVFDQSERASGPIYIIIEFIVIAVNSYAPINSKLQRPLTRANPGHLNF